jgi:hypothetical protein
VLVGSAIHTAPPVADLDVGLVNPDQTAMRPAKLAQPVFDHRRLSEDLAVDRAVVHVEAALAKHFLKVPVAERMGQIPSDRLYGLPCLELPPLEIVFPLALNLSAMAFSFICMLQNT